MNVLVGGYTEGPGNQTHLTLYGDIRLSHESTACRHGAPPPSQTRNNLDGWFDGIGVVIIGYQEAYADWHGCCSKLGMVPTTLIGACGTWHMRSVGGTASFMAHWSLPRQQENRFTCDRRYIMIKRIFASLMATLLCCSMAGTLAGCNTVRGVGQDIERGGQKLQEEATEHRRY